MSNLLEVLLSFENLVSDSYQFEPLPLGTNNSLSPVTKIFRCPGNSIDLHNEEITTFHLSASSILGC
jgi:hypothetical protein